ncbi:hypothetical protein [Allorhodopirellula heiligendammensis]|uniref:Uncharacterized protein n=1 Tax=Allorhodopirellula heiligendammensis TaxID=2714739 RepID=A0A5C6BFT7_9BACT|nr:hypothetical protein [Allorhodopirellula heiligendammensis]TWU10800.1 hypothetical protein Poly21_47060 [Allorhodopirellula heiligendammensis]
MDQLKPAIEFFKKNGFWIAVGLILLGSVGIWFKVTSDLVAESDARASKIKGDIGKVTSVRGELNTHPNPISHAKMEEMIDTREEQVLDAWTNVYEKQKDILVWPEDLTDELKDEYREKIPIELYVDFPTLDDQKLEPFLLQQYRMYIDKTLPKIAKIADAEWTAKFDSQTAAGGMGSGGMSDMYEMEGGMDSGMMTGPRDISITGVKKGPLVRWSSTAQKNLITELFPWQGRRPTTLEVYYSQESLWILRQLLEIIATVNGEAKQPFEAKIREIKQLSMGRKVRFTEGVLASPSVTGGMGMDGMMDSGMMDSGMGMDGSMMDSGMMGMDGMGMDLEAIDPADNRYVTPDHEPITGAELRSAFDSDVPDDAPLKVAKRVPVMISVRIDQRAVADLLAACGSAPLMVEVVQTRVFGNGEAPSSSASGGMDGGMGMDSGMGMGMESGMGMGMDSGMGMGMDGGGGYGTSVSDQFPLDVNVEVYGLIHVYNPPQMDKLGVEQITAETIIDGETMAEKVEVEKAAAAEDALPLPAPVATPPVDAPPADSAPAAVPPTGETDSPAENPGNPGPDPVEPNTAGVPTPAATAS